MRKILCLAEGETSNKRKKLPSIAKTSSSGHSNLKKSSAPKTVSRSMTHPSSPPYCTKATKVRKAVSEVSPHRSKDHFSVSQTIGQLQWKTKIKFIYLEAQVSDEFLLAMLTCFQSALPSLACLKVRQGSMSQLMPHLKRDKSTGMSSTVQSL